MPKSKKGKQRKEKDVTMAAIEDPH